MVIKFYNNLKKALGESNEVCYRYYGIEHTYDELYKGVSKVCNYLKSQTQEPVVLFGNKSFHSYAAIFGIILSKNIWVPLASDQASKRIEDIFDLTGAKLCFTETDPTDHLVSFCRERSIKIVHLNDIFTSKDPDIGFDVTHYNPDQIAYIMFTSGSTGVPKGVPVSHRNYINFINNAMDIISFERGDVFSDYHDFSFDISIFYLFCAPLVGGVLSPVITKEEKVLPLNYIQENRITIWSSVPSVINRLRIAFPSCPIKTNLRVAFLCGEPFDIEVLKYCQEILSIPDVYNFYGLTETGVENFYHHCEKDDVTRFSKFGYVPIGKPMLGNEISVTENDELLISGVQLTPGYLGQAGQDKFKIIKNKRWYHTGDIVVKKDGHWFCKGRLDTQVKVNGYRIELMDIEVNLKKITQIDQAVCFVSGNGPRKILNAVVKLVDKDLFDVDEINRELSKTIPEYMIPKRYKAIDSIPLTINGKIDRKKIISSFEQLWNST